MSLSDIKDNSERLHSHILKTLINRNDMYLESVIECD